MRPNLRPAIVLTPRGHYPPTNTGTPLILPVSRRPLVQSAGEVTTTARNDGTVGMLTIYPPTTPLQSPQRWAFQTFNSPAAAVNWLNEPAVQSDGEVSATLRNDGTVGMFVIEPA